MLSARSGGKSFDVIHPMSLSETLSNKHGFESFNGAIGFRFDEKYPFIFSWYCGREEVFRKTMSHSSREIRFPTSLFVATRLCDQT